MIKVHGEIEYYSKERGINVHSDICPPDCNLNNLTEEARKFYHDFLDEWLDKSGGTGCFYLKEEGHIWDS